MSVECFHKYEEHPTVSLRQIKIFYPLAMNYLYGLHGLVELASRGLIRRLETLRNNRSSVERDIVIGTLPISDEIKSALKQGLTPTPLIWNLNLKTSNGGAIEIPTNEISDDLFNNIAYLAPFAIHVGTALLVSAYSLVVDLDDH
jgi:hypothetical protein